MAESDYKSFERIYDTWESIYPNGLWYTTDWRRPFILAKNPEIEKHLANMRIYRQNERMKKKQDEIKPGCQYEMFEP